MALLLSAQKQKILDILHSTDWRFVRKDEVKGTSDSSDTDFEYRVKSMV